MKKLRAIIAGSALVVGGIAYQVVSYASGNEVCVRCRGRQLNESGPARYVDREMVAWIDADAGIISLTDPPSDFEVIGSCIVDTERNKLDDMACVLTGRNRPAPFDCACASKDGGCTLDGEEAPLGITLEPGRWSGAGCIPKACIEVAGEQGVSWPMECPR